MNCSILSKITFAAGLILCSLATQRISAQAGWTEDKPLNSYANSDQALLNEEAPRIESDGNGNWLAMWDDPNNTALAFSHSQDVGATWGPDTKFDSTSEARTSSTLYILDDAAHIYAGSNTWVSMWSIEQYHPDSDLRQLYTAYSTDNGTSWSQPVRLDPGGEITQPLTFATDIQLAADGTGNVLGLFAARSGSAPKLKYFLLRSTDYGQTWSTPENLSLRAGIPPNADQAQIACVGENKWLLVSTELEPGEIGSSTHVHQYFASTSSDLGHTWVLSGQILREYSNTATANYDLHANGNTAVVAWYHKLADTDGYGAIVSTDGGATFSPPNRLDSPALQNNIPLLSLGADAAGNWALTTQPAFGSTQPVIYTASDPATTWTGFTLTSGQNSEVDVAGGDAGEFIAVMRHIDPTAPVIQNDADIASVRSTDGGANWSLPVLVNEFATTDNTQVSDTKVDLEAGSSAMLSAWLTQVNNTYQGPAATSFSRSETKGLHWDPAAELAKVSTAVPDMVHVDAATWIVYWPTQGSTLGSIAYSINNGQTWSAPATLDSSIIATNNNGTLIRARSGGFLSRSLDGGLTWESETKPDITAVSHIVHTGGNNWLAVAAPSTMLVSNNNGATWAAHAAPPFTIEGIAADKSGVVLATSFTYEDGPNTNDRVAKTLVSRSEDGGITWSPLQLVHTQTRTEGGIVVEYTGQPQPLWLGGDQWAVFPKNILASRTQPLDRNYVRYVDIFYVQSDDGAQTWGTPELAVAKAGFDLPTGSDYAVKGNVVTIAYEVKELPNWYDGDLLYTNKIFRGTAAAMDWQLFN